MSDPLELARALMADFAESTGISGTSVPRRYLWTDAYAVCNFLALWQRSGDPEYLELARGLVTQVHHCLGQHRSDDVRSGWISGMSELQAEAHPTAGGLRIGKPLPERALHEPQDERTEWDRDGQYFHYLTKWAHALLNMTQATGEASFGRWAAELMAVAYHRFRALDDPPRLHWKMRIDLSTPLVSGSSAHDVVDGAVTCLALAADDYSNYDETLATTTAALLRMCDEQRLQTTDPLGLGGLLFDACRLARLPARLPITNRESLLRTILETAVQGLAHFARSPLMRTPATERLAFRELGLVIGLKGLFLLRDSFAPFPTCGSFLLRLREYDELSSHLLAFWSQPEHRHTALWLAHEDINSVMLATGLVPEGVFDGRGLPRPIHRFV
ncbi:MAG: hypothetical protein ACR2PZ_20505 [Pseudomonadales bacterium]